MLLPPEAIHPKIERDYEKLLEIADKKPGLLGDYPVLGIYLQTQLETLKNCDVMFAHDFGHDSPSRLMAYAAAEFIELAEEIPLFTATAQPVDGRASDEAGDVAWFLSMRVGLSHLDKEEHKLSRDEARTIAGMMGILSNLASIYPDFDPTKHASKVGKKVENNYPSRVLRAHPEMSLETMSSEFQNVRLPALKDFRSRLDNRKIPEVVYQAIQQGESKMPKVQEAKRGAIKRYGNVVKFAHQASKFYGY